MPRNIVQDVIPRNDRKNSIREIPISAKNFSKEIEEDIVDDEDVADGNEESESRFNHRKSSDDPSSWGYGRPGKVSRWFLWIIGVVSAAVLVFVLGNLFSGATVTVTPKSEKFSVDLNLTAKAKTTVGELSYTTYSLVRDKEEIVPADGERPVESRASGTIIVYNNYSASTQRLVKNTRFETPDGLIYKIANSITVPGRHIVAGENVPGSVETVVYAESAGDEYNIGLTDFTIPGFKSNSERFSNFYGRSKTAMTGGKIGTERFVSDEKLKQARERIDNEIAKELLAEAQANTPADLVFYESAYKVSFEPALSSHKVTGNNIPVTERARFTAFFIKRDELAAAVSQNLADNYDGSPVSIVNPEALKFTLKDTVNNIITSIGPINFNIKGDTTIVWKFDSVKLRNDLAGKNKSELAGIASQYPSIIKAEAVVRPFWKSTFPILANKIKFVTLGV